VDPDKALSLQSIRSATKPGSDDEMAFEAMWSSIGWMLPVQAVGLLLGGVDVLISIGLAVGISFGLALASPFAAGLVAAFVDGAASDRIAWILMIALASVLWVAAGGPVVGAVLAVIAVPMFLVLEGRYRARKAKAPAPHVLPEPLHARLAALPEDVPESILSQIDRALTAVESLHTLHADLPEGEGMWTDALACMERVVDRTEAALRLHTLPQQSEEVDKAKQAIDAQLDELSGQLMAVVDAGSRFIALDQEGAETELSERAESLHMLVEATQEVEDALR
jgi:hypothetical protein